MSPEWRLMAGVLAWKRARRRQVAFCANRARGRPASGPCAVRLFRPPVVCSPGRRRRSPSLGPAGPPGGPMSSVLGESTSVLLQAHYHWPLGGHVRRPRPTPQVSLSNPLSDVAPTLSAGLDQGADAVRIERHQVGVAVVSAAREDFTNRIGVWCGRCRGPAGWPPTNGSPSPRSSTTTSELSPSKRPTSTRPKPAALKDASGAAPAPSPYAAYHPHCTFQAFLEYVNFGMSMTRAPTPPRRASRPGSGLTHCARQSLRDKAKWHGEAFHFARLKFAERRGGTPVGESRHGTDGRRYGRHRRRRRVPAERAGEVRRRRRVPEPGPGPRRGDR